MKRVIILSAAIGLLAGCNWVGIRGNGHIVSDQRSVGDFSEIVASGGMKIEWHAGAPSLTITTDENLLSHIEDRITGSTLRLREHEHLRPTQGIKVTITSPRLTGGDLSGAVDLVAHKLTGPKFYIRGTGASDITLDGAVDELLADLTGAGDLKAKSLQVKTAEISATGAADAVVNVSDVLRVSITGAGDVVYYGTAKTIEKHITGAGSVNHKE
jgi:Putative auto-transporter adhesin, head GIN domain